MSSSTVIVALAGPPPVNRNGSRNTWAVPDDLQDQRHEQDAAELRQRDVPDLAARGRAVDLGRVVELRRDAESAAR